jgi:ABC-2 type transport system permease protein
MSLVRAYEWETRKLIRQRRTWWGLGAAVVYALAFVLTLSLKKHAGIPPDIPLAKQVTQTGVVLPLALLAFATFFGAPIISALVAGDIVSSEDANNTLKMILTRSTTRSTIYWAKTLAAATYGLALMVVLFATSIIGSTIAWGLHGATLLDGRRVGGGHALALDILAYATYLLPLFVLIGVAVFLSTVTRNSAAAIVGTVIFSLAWQGIAVLPGIKTAKNWLFPKQFDAWEALFGQTGDSIGRAALMCAIYALVPLLIGWAVFLRRDVAGA